MIFKLTAQHAIGLAKFVTMYKTLLLVQKRLHGGKQNSADTFFAGLAGGYVVFGDRTAINEQVRTRSLSQVFAGNVDPLSTDRLVRRITRTGILHTPRSFNEASRDRSCENCSSERASLLHLRCPRLGCRNVDIPRTGRDDPTRHVQLHELSIQRFREMEQLADVGVEEQVVLRGGSLSEHCPPSCSYSYSCSRTTICIAVTLA